MGATEQPVDTDVLVVIGAAVRTREVLRFDYATDRPGEHDQLRPPRRVEPHHLVTRSGRWYLVAWDLDRKDWRIHRADRIAPRTHTVPASSRANCPAAMFAPSSRAGSRARTARTCGPATAR